MLTGCCFWRCHRRRKQVGGASWVFFTFKSWEAKGFTDLGLVCFADFAVAIGGDPGDSVIAVLNLFYDRWRISNVSSHD